MRSNGREGLKKPNVFHAQEIFFKYSTGQLDPKHAKVFMQLSIRKGLI